MTTLDFLKDTLQLNDPGLLRDARLLGRIQRVKKGSHLFEPGQVPTRIYLLAEGIFRTFFVNADGQETTDCLVCTPGTSLMAVSDLRMPSPATTEALTDSLVFCLSVPDFAALFSRYPVVQQLYQQMLLFSTDYHRQLQVILCQYTAAQRYLWFLKHYPGVMDRISHRYIASFLNMTPVTLSRLSHTPDLADTVTLPPEPFPFPEQVTPQG